MIDNLFSVYMVVYGDIFVHVLNSFHSMSCFIIFFGFYIYFAKGNDVIKTGKNC